MGARFLLTILFFGMVVLQARPQGGERGKATKKPDVKIVATSIQQTLEDPDGDEEEGGALGGVEMMMFHPGHGIGATIQFRLEGEDQRFLVSARVESVTGPDGKPVSVGAMDRPGFNLMGPVHLQLNLAGTSFQGPSGFSVFLKGEEFSKSGKFLVRGKAKVAVGGNLRKQVFELESENGKKVKAGPFECRYQEEDNDPIENFGPGGEIEMGAGIQAGVYMGIMGVFQKLTGKGNFMDSLGGFLGQNPSAGTDQVIIKGPTQYLTSVREEGTNLEPSSYRKGKSSFNIPRKKPGKRKITLEYWEGVEVREIPFEFKGG